jgi:hypothetical protein
MKLQDESGRHSQRSSHNLPALRWVLACLACLLFLSLSAASTSAKSDPRRVTVARSYLATHWQLARWHTGITVCDIYSRLDGPPAVKEVVHFCGESTYQEWLSTPECSGSNCSGLMLRFMGRGMHSYQEQVFLPPISFQLESPDCIPGQICETRPHLHITAVEPVEGRRIMRLYLRTPDRMWMYEGSRSLFELPLTGEQGEWLEYWAVSDLGDESERVRLHFRSVPQTASGGYQLDLLAEEWAAYAPSGSLAWDLFPSLDRPLPKALEQPLTPRYLATTNRYALLAAHLIRAGLVDASLCPGGGFFANGAVNACGEQVSAGVVLEWQNRYDDQIFAAAQRHHIPARVLKGIIAQESQFWPLHDKRFELGLGMQTENGLDLLLSWNVAYFLEVCQAAYSGHTCSPGYASLSAEQKLVLKGALLQQIGTDAEIDLLAAALAANAMQTRQLVRNTMLYSPAEVTTYEDMWKLTIGNYYAGSGCTGAALQAVANTDVQLTWDNAVQNLRGNCQIASMYVERVFDLSK